MIKWSLCEISYPARLRRKNLQRRERVSGGLLFLKTRGKLTNFNVSSMSKKSK